MTALTHDCRERQAIHDELDRQIQEYLNRGGDIEKLPFGQLTGLAPHFDNEGKK